MQDWTCTRCHWRNDALTNQCAQCTAPRIAFQTQPTGATAVAMPQPMPQPTPQPAPLPSRMNIDVTFPEHVNVNWTAVSFGQVLSFTVKFAIASIPVVMLWTIAHLLTQALVAHFLLRFWQLFQ